MHTAHYGEAPLARAFFSKIQSVISVIQIGIRNDILSRSNTGFWTI